MKEPHPTAFTTTHPSIMIIFCLLAVLTKSLAGAPTEVIWGYGQAFYHFLRNSSVLTSPMLKFFNVLACG